MIRRLWNSQPAIGKSAHILERTGLALTGASCGLFVAAHVGRAASLRSRPSFLGRLGYVEGENLIVDRYSAEGHHRAVATSATASGSTGTHFVGEHRVRITGYGIPHRTPGTQ
jgi:hypothetical protein